MSLQPNAFRESRLQLVRITLSEKHRRHLFDERQRRATNSCCGEPRCTCDACARQYRRFERRVHRQQIRQVIWNRERMPHSRLGHTASLLVIVWTRLGLERLEQLVGGNCIEKSEVVEGGRREVLRMRTKRRANLNCALNDSPVLFCEITLTTSILVWSCSECRGGHALNASTAFTCLKRTGSSRRRAVTGATCKWPILWIRAGTCPESSTTSSRRSRAFFWISHLSSYGFLLDCLSAIPAASWNSISSARNSNTAHNHTPTLHNYCMCVLQLISQVNIDALSGCQGVFFSGRKWRPAIIFKMRKRSLSGIQDIRMRLKWKKFIVACPSSSFQYMGSFYINLYRGYVSKINIINISIICCLVKPWTSMTYGFRRYYQT